MDKIYKPSALIHFLKTLGIQPKKRLSQNFLLDQNIIKKIVKAAKVTEEDRVLEIGPGPGSLTEALLETGADVTAVEKDTILAPALERLQRENRLHIHCEDILKFPIEEHFSQDKKGKVIANLPYHLTTPIITKLLPLHDLFISVVVMVQEEVARRYTAAPGCKEYGAITLFLRYHSTPHYAFTVSPHCFYPKPKVTSAIVSFTLRPPPKVSNPEALFQLIHTAFEQRRKMLRSSLKRLYPSESVTQALESLGLDPQIRPEMLSLEQFIALYEKLSPQPRMR